MTIKKTILAATILAGAGAVAVTAGGEKVKIMHNGHVIEVSANAVNAHLNHGDEIMVSYEGELITESEHAQILEDLALAAEYQQYQDATAEDEQFEDEEEDGEDADEL